jgi:chemotaxis protein CheX
MPATATPTINVAYLNPFLTATVKVFQTMANLKAELEKPYLKQARQATHDISAMIGLSGAVVGAVVLTFSRRAAFQAVCAFSGLTITDVNGEFTDAVGELVNMIAGAAKAEFPVTGTSMSTPTVVVGHDHTIAGPQNVPTIVIPCHLSDGPFAVEFSLKPS